MRHGIIATTVLGLGMAAMAPMSVKADDWRRDRDDWRSHDEIRRERHWAETIDARDVPDRVRDRVDDYRHGRRIESARLVHDHGDIYYSFRINDNPHGDFYF